MSVKLKIIIGAIAAVVVLLLMLLWAFFAFEGRAPMDPFIGEIGNLITITVGLVAAFFGHQAASRSTGVDAITPAEFINAGPLVAPQPAALVSDPPAAPVAPPVATPAPVATAPTLQ